MMKSQNNRKRNQGHKGAVTVELAVMLPIALSILFGAIEISRGIEVSHQMTTAIREGARFAAMDKEGKLAEGQTTNDKVASDIRVFLTASGLPGGLVVIDITTVPDANTGNVSPFDLDDPDNDLKLFQIEAQLPYASVSHLPATFLDGKSIRSTIVFRNARSTLVN